MIKGIRIYISAGLSNLLQYQSRITHYAIYGLLVLLSESVLADCTVVNPQDTLPPLGINKSTTIRPLTAEYLDCTTPVGQTLRIDLEQLGVWEPGISTDVYFNVDNTTSDTYRGIFGTANIGTNQNTIIYSPMPGGNEYVGAQEQISYSVLRGQDEFPPTAVISITFTEAVVSNSPSNPERSIRSVVNNICTGNPTDLPDICTILSDLDGNEPLTDEFLRAISPTNVSAMSKSAGSIAKQQLDNVRQRLTQLRLGTQGGALQNLTIQFKDGSLDGSLLQSMLDGEQRGGGASADGGLASPLSGFISGSFGDTEGDHSDNADGFELSNTNITAGLDYRLNDQSVLGAALGFSRGDSDLTQDSGGFDVDGINLSIYGSHYLTPKVYLDGILSVNQQDFDARRTIQFNGGGFNVNETSTASTDNSVLALSLESGYELSSNAGITTTLMLRLDYLDSTLEAYEENGAGQYDLKIAERDISEMNSNLGVRVVKALSQPWGVLLPQIDLSWVHEFEDEGSPVTGSFADDTSGSTFELATDANDRDYFKLSLGVTSIVANGPTGYLQFDKTIARDGLDEQQLSLGMRIEF